MDRWIVKSGASYLDDYTLVGGTGVIAKWCATQKNALRFDHRLRAIEVASRTPHDDAPRMCVLRLRPSVGAAVAAERERCAQWVIRYYGTGYEGEDCLAAIRSGAEARPASRGEEGGEHAAD